MFGLAYHVLVQACCQQCNWFPEQPLWSAPRPSSQTESMSLVKQF